jgi:UDP-N-acetylmuramyl pentapeptide phosphotransferase/UDP-N-acetylglucosamine-1-phosphate transferase
LVTGIQFLQGVSFGLAGVAVFVASAGASALVRTLLVRWQVLDPPNARSSHKRPIPRGGGVGFMLLILLVWLTLWQQGSPIVGPAVIAGALAVAAGSFADDLRGVAVWQRLLVQAGAVFVALTFLPFDGPILANFLPIPIDRLIAGLLWLWFINLFNFMDGIDGIAGAEAGIIGLGIAVLAAFRPDLGLPGMEAITVGTAALGFLVFNWPPARMFMGDVGSTGLGFVLGWLLLTVAAKGVLIPALLLPLYFAADATTTLAYRAWHRRPLSAAHRDHAYQQGVDAGLTHAAVSLRVVVLGVFLIVAAVVALDRPAAGLAAGVIATFGLIASLRWQPVRA